MKKLTIVLTIIVLLGIFFFLYYKEGTLPVEKNSQETKIFVVKKGEGLNQIIKNLMNEGLIRNKVVFYLIVKNMGIEKKIQAGDFRLSPSMSAYEIAENLTHGTLDVWTTIIEGLRKEEIAQIISKSLDIPESEFIKNAKEGYLFPDTYLIPKDAVIDTVLNIMTSNFENKYSQELKEKAKKLKLTDEEVIILASLVEKEARLDEDRQEVASIILKRYQEDWPLQIDATVQYALGYQSAAKTWWKKDLTHEDLEIDSSYNTYKNQGLPPSPICNPGLSSIEAVVNADPSTLYWYYISDKTGKMHFAKTLEEHNQYINRYLK
jgi:UPF0755 protein